MTATCTILSPRPQIDFDETVLTEICDRHGENAEAHLARLLRKVETLLALARMQVEQGHLDGLRRTCQDLVPAAGAVGMRSLGQAVAGVLDCLDTGDQVALAACAWRLITMGQPEVFRDWTVHDDTVA